MTSQPHGRSEKAGARRERGGADDRPARRPREQRERFTDSGEVGEEQGA